MSDENLFLCYDIGVIPEHIGVFSPQQWHISLRNSCTNLEDGVKLGRKILEAFQGGEKCPCGNGDTKDCQLVKPPNYYVRSAEKPRIRKKRGKLRDFREEI